MSKISFASARRWTIFFAGGMGLAMLASCFRASDVGGTNIRGKGPGPIDDPAEVASGHFDYGVDKAFDESRLAQIRAAMAKVVPEDHLVAEITANPNGPAGPCTDGQVCLVPSFQQAAQPDVLTNLLSGTPDHVSAPLFIPHSVLADTLLGSAFDQLTMFQESVEPFALDFVLDPGDIDAFGGASEGQALDPIGLWFPFRVNFA